ncbi:hypothetical protein [Nocardioides sp. AX2bis]|uniref:hypothetical protein n=1 Tax=Nocardioides sp. AX2bis TaxID=2653157 RepID=UPI0012F103BC|nr:hypothetical protein [Nocardioides sp. AX2bis]VXB56740.1 hypothetical protein NOCARDAX2BIS_240021 [Nocardioides sp. AX2bis]
MSFVGSAMVYAVIAYMVGSRQDRDHVAFWRSLLVAWVFIVAATVAWTIYLSVADGEIAWRAAESLILQGLLMALVVSAYLRTSAGRPWRSTPDDAPTGA